MSNSNEIIMQLSAKLSLAVKAVLKKFSIEHPNDTMYAFALVAPPEGTYISCAIATEQTLDRVVKSYGEMGYVAKSGDTLAMLRQELRWANPDDGWYNYSFPENESILLELEQAFNSKRIENFDGTTEAICTDALKKLDLEHVFGCGEDRNNLAISFTYGEDPEDFLKFSEKLNAPTIVQRIRQELTDSYKVAAQMNTPYD